MMEKHDTLYEQMRDAAGKAEEREFRALEKVWSRVEDKLDHNAQVGRTQLWKKLAVAASLLLCGVVGYEVMKDDGGVMTPVAPNVERPVVTKDEKREENTAYPDTSASSFISTTPDISADPARSAVADIDETVIETVKEKDKPYFSAGQNGVAVSDDMKKDIERFETTNASSNVAISEHSPALLDNKFTSTKGDTASNSLLFKKMEVTTVVSENFSGIVYDEMALPLPGVAITVQGTTRGTQTDFDGKFSIAVSKGEKLVFSYVGLNTKTIAFEGKKTPTKIELQNNAMALQEVVVEGYNITRPKAKSNASVAVASSERRSENRSKRTRIEGIVANNVPAAEQKKPGNEDGRVYRKGDHNGNAGIENVLKTLPGVSGNNEQSFGRDADGVADSSSGRPNASFIETLQSQVAGLNVTTGTGQPGANGTVILRGIASLNGNIEPLYVVDGIPLGATTLKSLSTDDIESINVLKDASATALYGNRGANGVIVIKTKGSDGKPKSRKQLKKWLKELEKLPKSPTGYFPEPTGTEEYNPFVENPFESPRNNPLSTFSIDVDNASYTNVRRFINNGQDVPKDAVRIEEMVNFFNYGYAQPTGPHPFSIDTEYTDCPWNAGHKLLRIGLQGKSIPTEILPASNLVFLIDVSGSMNADNKLPLLKESLKILLKQLRRQDKVAIVVYAGAAGLVLPPTSGDKKDEIIKALDNLSAGGSTAGGAGIELAYKIAEENFIKGGNNRVLLATDGDFNVGSSSDQDMQALIEEKRKSGVYLTCLGYGMGNYKDAKMQVLAEKGNGNHSYIDNIQEANRFLGKEFKGSMYAIVKDVKIQIEFNPAVVHAYRLIGYESRKLRDEDFTNDAIDAGELGSGHTVTAFYEVIPAGAKSDFFSGDIPLKYTQATNSGTIDELATVKFRYKKPDGDKSIEMIQVIPNRPVPLQKSSEGFRFGAAVVWFGLKLRDSEWVKNKSAADIERLARTGLENDPDGYKAECIRLMESLK